MNRTAIVTGASRGIGRGIVTELASLGFDVVINYASSPEKAGETKQVCEEKAREHGFKITALTYKADIGNPDERESMMRFSREAFGHLDVLVNNAGITSIGRSDILEAKEENFDKLMAINLKGPYFLSQLAAKWMIETKQKSDKPQAGKIVNISSISSWAVSTNRGDYCMGKAALGMMTKLFAVRLAEEGIGVFEVCPGVIASDMTAPVKAKYDKLIEDGLWPIKRWGEPKDVALAVSAIVQGSFPFSTGQVFDVDGGFHIRSI